MKFLPTCTIFFRLVVPSRKFDAIDDLIIWGVIEEDLDSLVEDVDRLLKQTK